MRTRSALVAIALTLSALVVGCRAQDDVYARYTLERRLWKAQVHERKINIGFLKASQRDLGFAIDAFNEVVAYDPLVVYDTRGWDPKVVRDIKRIRVASKIALANLYFLSERFHSASDFYARTLEETDLDLQHRLDVRLNLARTMYLAGEPDPVEQQCAQIFREIAESEDFWSGNHRLKDVFLNIPLVLVRLYRERGDTADYESFSRLADDFYGRVAATWPDSAIAASAVFSRANLHLIREEWQSALDDVERLLVHPAYQQESGSLLLLKGEILAFGMDDRRRGAEVFQTLIERFPDAPTAHAAKYNLATLAIERGDVEAGVEILREVESSRTAPQEIASRAMLARALQLERANQWDEAIRLLRRIMSLVPNSTAAIQAPLVITRHYVASGDREMAERNLERAKEYYLALIARQSKFQGNRLMVEDFLIENFLMMDRPREIASILEKESGGWDESSTVGGMFKSALIYSTLLDDKESAERILKKSIELFPETRYAKIAQQQLDILHKESTNNNGGG